MYVGPTIGKGVVPGFSAFAGAEASAAFATLWGVESHIDNHVAGGLAGFGAGSAVAIAFSYGAVKGGSFVRNQIGKVRTQRRNRQIGL